MISGEQIQLNRKENLNEKLVCPKISCIVPVYNVEKYLSRCVDSILAQTFTDFELILVDDGSPDDSGIICDEYAEKDSRIEVIHKSNGGVSSARNAGLDIASGKYVCFVDSDDWVEQDYMQDMHEAIIKTNSDLVICGIRRQKKNGTFVNLNIASQNNVTICKNREDFLNFFSFLRKKLKNTVELHSPVNKLYSIYLIGNIRFDERMIVGEDYCFNLHLFEKTNSCICIHKGEYCYAYNENSVINAIDSIERRKRKVSDLKTSIDLTVSFFKKNCLDESDLSDFIAKTLYSISINSIHFVRPERKENYDYVRNRINIFGIFKNLNKIKIFITLLVVKCHLEYLLILIYKLIKKGLHK